MEHVYYYLDKDNRQTGPLSWKELQALHLPGSTLVWHEGLPSWVRLSSLATRTESRAGFFHRLTPLRIVLLVYAVLGTLLMLVVGRFLFAFLSSCTYRHVDELPWFVLLFAVVLFLPALFIQRRRYMVHAALVLFPLWMGSLASGIYYKVLCETYSYNEGYCLIRKPGQGWGVINRWGLECVPCIYEKVAYDSYFNPRYCLVVSDGRMGACDLDGNMVVPCEWKSIVYDKYRSLWLVRDRHNMLGLLNEDGSPLLSCEYDHASDWLGDMKLLEVEKGDWFGLFRPADGTWALQCIYVRTNFNDDGYAKLNAEGYIDSENYIRGGRWGALNQKGEMIVPCIYDKVTLDDDEIRGELNGITYCYDYRGNVKGVY